MTNERKSIVEDFEDATYVDDCDRSGADIDLLPS